MRGRMTNDEKVRVLYVGGCGRSGSTLLDRMVGQLPGVCSVGELGQIWKAVAANQECGCTVPIRECAFWRAVGERAFGGWGVVDVRGLHALHRAVVRQRHVALLVAPELSRTYRRRLRAYAAVVQRLYRAIRAVSGASLIVDSTKHYVNALLLAGVDGIDLRVVHLVRDSRGVAYSWNKSVRRPESVHGGAHMNRYGTVRSAVRWIGYNAGFDALATAGVPTLLARYEDLVDAPRVELGRIVGWAGLDVEDPAWSFVNGHEVQLGVDHTVAGNPMRFRVGSVRLRVDEEWKERLPVAQRRVVSLLTWPMLLRYGYRGDAATRPSTPAMRSPRIGRPAPQTL